VAGVGSTGGLGLATGLGSTGGLGSTLGGLGGPSAPHQQHGMAISVASTAMTRNHFNLIVPAHLRGLAACQATS
jgi:hypothetical protein